MGWAFLWNDMMWDTLCGGRENTDDGTLPPLDIDDGSCAKSIGYLALGIPPLLFVSASRDVAHIFSVTDSFVPHTT